MLPAGTAVADLTEDSLELRPALGVPGQIPRRFGQEAHEDGGDDERQHAADGEEGCASRMIGMTYPATSAASVPPSGTQTIVSVMANGRYRRGTYSEASAAALGIAPPRPSPARKRSAPRAQRLSTSATAAVRTPKMRTLPMSAKRRPIRSPMRPASAPPIIMPIMPLASTALNARARHRPVPHHRGDGDAEQLVVDAVEDDRERRQEDEELLAAAPAPVVEQVADVDRVSTWHARSLWVRSLDFTIRVVQIAPEC